MRLRIVAAFTVLVAGSSFQGLSATPLLPPQSAPRLGAHWLAQAQAPKRSALVIGNGAYAEESLANAVNDAEDVARTLQEIGFQVTLLKNADKRTMDEAVDSFRRQLSQGDYGLFYFSGHGVQVAGESYLIPLRASLNIEADVKYNAVPLGTIINAVEASEATARIIIIDACRDNPFYRRWRSSITRSVATRGLATPMVVGRGTLIAFSTAPDQKAEDGIGERNSPFTTYLLRHLKASKLDVRLMLGRVRGDVLQATRNKQIPWTNESLVGEVYLNPQASQSPAPATPPTPPLMSGFGAKAEKVVAATMSNGKRAYGPLIVNWLLIQKEIAKGANFIMTQATINSASAKGTVELKFSCKSNEIHLRPLNLSFSTSKWRESLLKELTSFKNDACPIQFKRDRKIIDVT